MTSLLGVFGSIYTALVLIMNLDLPLAAACAAASFSSHRSLCSPCLSVVPGSRNRLPEETTCDTLPRTRNKNRKKIRLHILVNATYNDTLLAMLPSPVAKRKSGHWCYFGHLVLARPISMLVRFCMNEKAKEK